MKNKKEDCLVQFKDKEMRLLPVENLEDLDLDRMNQEDKGEDKEMKKKKDKDKNAENEE